VINPLICSPDSQIFPKEGLFSSSRNIYFFQTAKKNRFSSKSTNVVGMLLLGNVFVKSLRFPPHPTPARTPNDFRKL
jgi:hypothetical protein